MASNRCRPKILPRKTWKKKQNREIIQKTRGEGGEVLQQRKREEAQKHRRNSKSNNTTTQHNNTRKDNTNLTPMWSSFYYLRQTPIRPQRSTKPATPPRPHNQYRALKGAVKSTCSLMGLTIIHAGLPIPKNSITTS